MGSSRAGGKSSRRQPVLQQHQRRHQQPLISKQPQRTATVTSEHRQHTITAGSCSITPDRSTAAESAHLCTAYACLKCILCIGPGSNT